MPTPTKSIYRKYAHLVQQYFFYLKVSKKNGALRAWQLEIVSSWSTLGSPMALSGPSITGSIIWTLINSYNIIYKNNIFNLSKKIIIYSKNYVYLIYDILKKITSILYNCSLCNFMLLICWMISSLSMLLLFLDFQTVVFGFPNFIIYRSCY